MYVYWAIIIYSVSKSNLIVFDALATAINQSETLNCTSISRTSLNPPPKAKKNISKASFKSKRNSYNHAKSVNLDKPELPKPLANTSRSKPPLKENDFVHAQSPVKLSNKGFRKNESRPAPSAPLERQTKETYSFGIVKKSKFDLPTLTSLNRRKRPTLNHLLERVRTEKEKRKKLEPEDKKKRKHDHLWKKTFKRVSGEKVLDDEKKILSSIKKRELKKKKSAEQWAMREQQVENKMAKRRAERQKKISERLQTLKDKRDARRLKRLIKKSKNR